MTPFYVDLTAAPRQYDAAQFLLLLLRQCARAEVGVDLEVGGSTVTMLAVSSGVAPFFIRRKLINDIGRPIAGSCR